MSKKYVIEIKHEYEDKFRGIMILGAENSNLYVDSVAVDELEELNSDYINENFGELQDAAYQKGLEEGKKAFDLLESERNSEYQRGLNEAWEAARKLFSSMADSDIEKAFPTEWNNGGFNALISLQPQEAIAKLKAYEDKQKADDKIKVGDVVMIKQFKHPENHLFVVTKVSDESVWGVEGDGSWNYWAINEVIKTDKHFDIQKILEGMK